MAKGDKLAHVREQVAVHLDEIATYFSGTPKLTICVRHPGQPEQDFLLTSDTLDEVILLLERSKTRPET